MPEVRNCWKMGKKFDSKFTGVDVITLQTAAGGAGRALRGCLLIRANHEKNGNPRRKCGFRIRARNESGDGGGFGVAGYDVEI